MANQKTDGGEYVSGRGTKVDNDILNENDLINAESGVTNLELLVVLHKGNGVPSNQNIGITGDSAFTVQYITKYMPSAFYTKLIMWQ